MIEVWFFIALFLVPGPFIHEDQLVASEYIGAYTSSIECEIDRTEFDELWGGVHEDGVVTVSPECVRLVITTEGHRI